VVTYDQSSWDPYNLELQNCHHNQTSISVPPQPDLNLFHLLPNSSFPLLNQTQKPGNFPANIPGNCEGGLGSNAVYDPLFHLNLPPQPPLFRELFQSLPHGYGFGGSRTLFGGLEEREGSGGGGFQDGEGRGFDNGVLEFTREMNCLAKGRSNGKGAAKQFTTEKQRRDDLNDKYNALKSLVPNPTKSDRASVVGDAIEYIKELLRTVDELKLLVEKKRCGRERMSKRHKAAMDGENEEVESTCIKGDSDAVYHQGSSPPLRSSWLQRKSKGSEVDVRIVDDEVTIKLAQRKKISNCLVVVARVLDELQLDIQHVAGGLVGDNYSFLFNSKIYEGSSVYASAIAHKLIEVVDTEFPCASTKLETSHPQNLNF
ncbi:hypothetical protein NMG60_11029316, partial [Bertholletia excelsa]